MYFDNVMSQLWTLWARSQPCPIILHKAKELCCNLDKKKNVFLEGRKREKRCDRITEHQLIRYYQILHPILCRQPNTVNLIRYENWTSLSFKYRKCTKNNKKMLASWEVWEEFWEANPCQHLRYHLRGLSDNVFVHIEGPLWRQRPNLALRWHVCSRGSCNKPHVSDWCT